MSVELRAASKKAAEQVRCAMGKPDAQARAYLAEKLLCVGPEDREALLGVMMRRMCKEEGHRQGVPSNRHPNQYDNLSELERKILKGKHRYSVAKMAALYNTSQKRVREILESRNHVI